MEFRKVWKYSAVLCEMSELKKGDIFQMQKRDSNDLIQEDELLIATEDPAPCTDAESSHQIMAVTLWAKPNRN